MSDEVITKIVMGCAIDINSPNFEETLRGPMDMIQTSTAFYFLPPSDLGKNINLKTVGLILPTLLLGPVATLAALPLAEHFTNKSAGKKAYGKNINTEEMAEKAICLKFVDITECLIKLVKVPTFFKVVLWPSPETLITMTGTAKINNIDVKISMGNIAGLSCKEAEKEFSYLPTTVSDETVSAKELIKRGLKLDY